MNYRTALSQSLLPLVLFAALLTGCGDTAVVDAETTLDVSKVTYSIPDINVTENDSGQYSVKIPELTDKENILGDGPFTFKYFVNGIDKSDIILDLNNTTVSSGENTIYIQVTETGGKENNESQFIGDGFPFTITVSPQVIENVAPTASNVNVTTLEDTEVPVIFNGTDANNDTLVYDLLTQPTNGTLNNGVYTPNSNYNGTDNFTYVASDGLENSNTATVNITITPVNDAAILFGDFNGTVMADLEPSDTDSGIVSTTDIDSPNELKPETVQGMYGHAVVTKSGWTYHLDNSKQAIKDLPEGENLFDTIIIRSADGSASQVLGIKIQGNMTCTENPFQDKCLS